MTNARLKTTVRELGRAFRGTIHPSISRNHHNIIRFIDLDGVPRALNNPGYKSVKSNRMPRGNWWRQSVQWVEYAQKHGRLAN